MNGNELSGNELLRDELPNELSGNELFGNELLRLEIKKAYPEFQMKRLKSTGRSSPSSGQGCGKPPFCG